MICTITFLISTKFYTETLWIGFMVSSLERLGEDQDSRWGFIDWLIYLFMVLFEGTLDTI